MSKTTVIRNASWVVAWSESSGQHCYQRNKDITFCADQITYIGDHFDGHTDKEISGTDLMVMPGLINIHTHPTSEPLRKGITDETRSPNFHHSSLYEFLTVFNNDEDGVKRAHKVAMAELLLSGCTTFVDYSRPFDGWIESLAKSGIRSCIAPMFADAPWFTKNGHSVEYDWSNSERGPLGFGRAKACISEAGAHQSGRLSGMVAPSQIDTVSESLIKTAYAYAQEHDLPFQTHASQSVHEFNEMIRRHGKTPVQWMDSLGILSDRTIIGHAIFLDHHPWLHWSTREDITLLAKSGATVAHCPTVFARRGIALQSFGLYDKAGINLGIGTDTYPHNILDEMRTAAISARLAVGSVDDLNTSDIFNAATVNGAKALRRKDIGRLAPGLKADFVLVDLKHPSMRPMREPLRSLIYVAAERAVKDVYIDGTQVVSNGQCLTIDINEELAGLEEAQQRSIERVPSIDFAGRSANKMSPMVFPSE